MRYASTFSLAAITLLGATAIASADELWRQDPVNSFGGLASQDARNPGGLGWFAEVVNDFTASSDWTVESVQFWGGYAQVGAGNTHGFMIRFYENDNGNVGALVDTQDVLSFNETVYHTVVSGGITNGWEGFHVTLNLNTPVQLPAGDYWISVVAILDRGGTANEPQWGWIDAQNVVGSGCMQRFFSPTFGGPRSDDVAFVLEGSVGSVCYADCDGSGALNIFDYICFGNEYAAGTSYADCDGSGSLNIFDYICFGNEYAAGCP
ncbi:MAG: hypothetical protein H6815_04635 [Phycisphaeraceae bacterium]|nr:hypothetical protein [Phycisphaerales bacterium]MCB9859720.1 hypothetical protein [Phycisphaeraceae bacterium]